MLGQHLQKIYKHFYIPPHCWWNIKMCPTNPTLGMHRWGKRGNEQRCLNSNFYIILNILISRSQTAYCLGHKNDSEEIYVTSQDVDSKGLKQSAPNSADLSLMSSLMKSSEVMLKQHRYIDSIILLRLKLYLFHFIIMTEAKLRQ